VELKSFGQRILGQPVLGVSLIRLLLIFVAGKILFGD
jgi:hypothetical protein